MLVPDRLYLYNSLMMRFTNINTALPGAAWKNNDFPTKAALLGRMYEREIARERQASADPTVAQILAMLEHGRPGRPRPGPADPQGPGHGRQERGLRRRRQVPGPDGRLASASAAWNSPATTAPGSSTDA